MPSRSTTSHLTSHLEVSTELGAFLGDKRVRLLEEIARHGSISQAARHVPLSYKAAWDAVDAMNNLADRPLVERCAGGRAGGGTTLTQHGRRVVAMYRAVEAEYQGALERLAAHFANEPAGDMPAFRRLLRRMAVRTSARNQFAGTVAALRPGGVDVEVAIRIDPGLEISATVTLDSARQLELAVDAEVTALVKASALTLLVDEASCIDARNRLWGSVARVVEGPANAEVTLALGSGRSAVAVVTRATLETLGLRTGERACAAFDGASVMLAVVD